MPDPADNPPVSAALTTGASLAGRAFWGMLQRMVIAAACVDVAFFALFMAVGSPLLAWLNVVSVAMYAAAYVLIGRRANLAALVLIWLEVLGHALVGTLLIGWDSGFHYYLLMFIPGIVVSSTLRQAVLLVGLLLAFYLGMDVAARVLGPLAPISPAGLLAVNWFNVAIVFVMFAALARYFVGTVRRAQGQLHVLATRDPLTGLFNRRHFQALADHVLAHGRRAEESVALVIADVDLFKHINDAHGHDAGDKVLVHIAELLKRVCRDQDILARWGGEEFLALLPDTSAEGAVAAAQRMRQAAQAEVVNHERGSIRFTMSFGVTTLREGESLGDAVARADRAMYRSKAEGRNRVTSE